MNSVLVKNAKEGENEVMHNYQSGSLLVIYNDRAGIKLSNLNYYSVAFKYLLLMGDCLCLCVLESILIVVSS